MESAGGCHIQRCCIVLAAGDGRRLQDFVQQIRGDRLPKQYVDFQGGGRSLLEETFIRARRLVSPERIFTVVGRDHLRYPEVRKQLSARDIGRVIIQPENKETAHGILLSLAYIFKAYPKACIAIFPSDHFIAEEEVFMAHADLACRLVERHRDYLVLLGIQPDFPQSDYGYIVPGKPMKHLEPLNVRPVLHFKEKPHREAAEELMMAGGLWNTMVMIFTAETMVALVRRLSPQLNEFFEHVLDAIGTNQERQKIDDVYRDLRPANFSTGVLEAVAREDPQRLLVVPVHNVRWSDWGSEIRIVQTIGKMAHNAKMRRPNLPVIRRSADRIRQA
jgi:mannose-1-phosphate guanylyltransferase